MYSNPDYGVLGFWHCLVLQVDTDFTEVHAASIFRVEMNGMKMLSGYIGRLYMGGGHLDPQEEKSR
jgi:hypothetical protein